MTEDRGVAVRAAFRVEGDWWVAYFAKVDTMDGAEEIARIRMAFVEPDEQRRDEFMQLTLRCLEDHLRRVAGINRLDLGELGWKKQSAPESERAGNA